MTTGRILIINYKNCLYKQTYTWIQKFLYMGMKVTKAHFQNPCLTFEMYGNTIEKDKEI